MSAAIPLKRVSTKITHNVTMVDCEMAKRWLSENTNNRTPRQGVVQRYRNDMSSGRWGFAGDPIRFDDRGNLLDGQHRLLALSEIPGLTVPLLVIRGLSASSQSVMDQGVKRTPGDQLQLVGVKDANNVAAAVKVFLIWESGLLFRDAKLARAISSPQIEAWVSAHPTDLDFLQGILGICKQNDAPPSVASAAAIAFGRIDREQARKFFTLLSRGAGTEGHPIVTLDKRLQRIRREGIRLPARDYLALIILGWNAWRANRTITQFMRPKGGAWSDENFPEPK